MSLSTGQVLNNRYRIVKSIAAGGFGEVYRAWDMSLNSPCALKENHDLTPEASQQFAREAALLANLRHSNLPRVTDHFILPNQGQYLIMDFIEGEDLQAMLDRTGQPIDEHQALAWLHQICDALSYLHSQTPPIIHRDIKPANIIIAPEDKAMLVDFSIAKLYDPNRKTTRGARAVTSGYSPPEQYGQGSTDARSDVYALGATLYTLLTNQEPPESVALLGGSKLTRPRDLNPGIRVNTERAILKAMRTAPDQRHQSIEEFTTALQPRRRSHPTKSVPLSAVSPTPAPPVSVPVTPIASPPVVRAASAPPQAIPVSHAPPAPPPARQGFQIGPIWILAVLFVGLIGLMSLSGITALLVQIAGPLTAPTNTPRRLPTRTAAIIGISSPTAGESPVTESPVILPSRIAFSSGFEIFTILPDGSHIVQLTRNEVNDLSPTWSPDRSQIAYQSNALGNYDIWIMDADGENQSPLTADVYDERTPSWSPDGQWIAFASEQDGNRELYVARPDGSQFIRLTNNQTIDEFPAWSPDGTRLAFVSNREGNPEIFVMDVSAFPEVPDDSVAERLTKDPAIDWSPAWSPDGVQVAFASDRSGDWNIFVLNLNDGNLTQITFETAADQAPTWSPDGGQVAFVSNRGGPQEVYVMDSDGSSVKRLTEDERADITPAWFSP